MLKFLQNRTHQKPLKSPKKYNPQFLYGNSHQSPKQFQTNHTIFYKPSYVNPYLSYEKERVAKLPSQSLQVIDPKWIKKVDLQSVEEQKIVSLKDKEDFINYQDFRHSRYLTSFHSQLDQSKDRFRKIRGEFSTFIEKNNKFKPLGPLHGDQRDQTRINLTKRSVWLKPSQSMYEQVGTQSLQPSTEMNFSLRSGISKNSELLIQKQRIRQNREKLYNQHKRTLEKRKFENPNKELFELPKKGPEHQLTFLRQAYNTNFNRHSMIENKTRVEDKEEDEQLDNEIGKFQSLMYSKIN